MSDRMAAKIQIGGKLPSTKLDEFLILIDGLHDGWDQQFMYTSNADEFRRYQITHPGPITCCNVEVADGTFTDLEQFCFDNNLTYVQYSASMLEYDACLSWWKPDMGNQTGDCLSTNGEQPVVILDQLASAIKAARTLDDLKALIDMHTPCDVPPFEVV